MKGFYLAVLGMLRAASSRLKSMTLSSTKLLAQAFNMTWDSLAPSMAHAIQRGFIPGRRMLLNIFQTLSLVHTWHVRPRSCLTSSRLAEGIKAGAWIAIYSRSGRPSRLMSGAVKALYYGSCFDIVFWGVVTSVGVVISWGVGVHPPGLCGPSCSIPSRGSGSRLTASPIAPWTVFADDLGAALLSVLGNVGPILDVFCILPQSTGLHMNMTKFSVVNHACMSHFDVHRQKRNETCQGEMCPCTWASLPSAFAGVPIISAFPLDSRPSLLNGQPPLP